MKFEISESIHSANDAGILDGLEAQFKKTSEKVERYNGSLTVSSIQASFGSINRTDKTLVTIKPAKNGLMLVAEVNYRPSGFFWLFLILCLFTWVFWLIPIVFYLVQKNTVKESIAEVFKRIKDEFEQSEDRVIASGEGLIHLEKYAALKDKGIITEQEFNVKKKQILGF